MSIIITNNNQMLFSFALLYFRSAYAQVDMNGFVAWFASTSPRALRWIWTDLLLYYLLLLDLFCRIFLHQSCPGHESNESNESKVHVVDCCIGISFAGISVCHHCVSWYEPTMRVCQLNAAAAVSSSSGVLWCRQLKCIFYFHLLS